jgi:hypothetical protein
MPSNGIGPYDKGVSAFVHAGQTSISIGPLTPANTNTLAFFVALGQNASNPNGYVPLSTVGAGWTAVPGSGSLIYSQIFTGLSPITATGTFPPGMLCWGGGLLLFKLIGNSYSVVQQANQSGAFFPPYNISFFNPTVAGNTILALNIVGNVQTFNINVGLNDNQSNPYTHPINVGFGAVGYPGGYQQDVWFTQNIPGGNVTETLTGNGGNSSRASVFLEIAGSIPDPVIFAQAVPSSIFAGQSSTVSWVTTGATSLTSNEFGSIPLSGNRVVVPPTTNFYHFHAIGPGGTADAVVEVDVNSNESRFNLEKLILTMKQEPVTPVRGRGGSGGK